MFIAPAWWSAGRNGDATAPGSQTSLFFQNRKHFPHSFFTLNSNLTLVFTESKAYDLDLRLKFRIFLPLLTFYTIWPVTCELCGFRLLFRSLGDRFKLRISLICCCCKRLGRIRPWGYEVRKLVVSAWWWRIRFDYEFGNCLWDWILFICVLHFLAIFFMFDSKIGEKEEN